MNLDLHENLSRGTNSLPVEFIRTHMIIPGNYMHLHWHEQIELQYIISGEGVVTCDQTDYPVSAGDFLIVNSYETHSGFCITPSLDAYVLVFDMKDFSAEYAKRPFLFQSMIKNDATIKNLMTSIFAEEEERKAEYTAAIKGFLYHLVTYLVRNYKYKSILDTELRKNKDDLNRLAPAIKFIEKNYADSTITLTQLATISSLSVSRFSHLFKSTLEMSPTSYLNQYRLGKAYKLLIDGALSPSEIACLVGFSDYNNFSRQFQKKYNKLPSKLRQEGKEPQNP